VRVNDAVIGVALVLFAAAMIWYTRTFPEMPGQHYGPALFPVLIGIGFLLTGVILIARGVARLGTEPLFSGGAWLRSGPHVMNFVAIVGGLLLYILVSDRLGFILTSLLLLAGWLLLFRGGRPISSLAIALGVTLAVDYLFSKLLLVPLPAGVLQPLLY
jgi:putative tricarboxylic transport membrane protein